MKGIESMTEQLEPLKIEKRLLNRRVQIRSLDWQRTITGQLVRVEPYYFILQLDNGGIIALLKHACSTIAPVKADSSADDT